MRRSGQNSHNTFSYLDKTDLLAKHDGRLILAFINSHFNAITMYLVKFEIFLSSSSINISIKEKFPR